VAGAIGGENVTQTIEGRAHFPVNLRYPREYRDTPQRVASLPMLTPLGRQTTLGSVATVSISDGPPMLKSENARPSGWVFVDVRGRDLASVADDLRSAVAQQVPLETGMSIAYSGQFEYLERADARLKVMVPATLLIIFVLLYLTFSGDRTDAALPLVKALIASGGPAALIFETLAERTLALAQLARRSDPEAGYEPLLDELLRPVLPLCL